MNGGAPRFETGLTPLLSANGVPAPLLSANGLERPGEDVRSS